MTKNVPADTSTISDWFGDERAKTIVTASFKLTQYVAGVTAKKKAISLVFGEAGLGKSVAAKHAIRTHEADGLATARVEFRERSTMKGIATTLLAAVAGFEGRGELRHIEGELIAALETEDRLIVIDEAQRLNRECIEYLRYLHDNPDARFGLILVGGHGCHEVIQRYPMLNSRVLLRVEFKRLTLKETLEIIPQYHPIYERAEPALLARIHRDCTHGYFRAWSKVTSMASELCENAKTPTINDRIADTTLRLIGAQG